MIAPETAWKRLMREHGEIWLEERVRRAMECLILPEFGGRLGFNKIMNEIVEEDLRVRGQKAHWHTHRARAFNRVSKAIDWKVKRVLKEHENDAGKALEALNVKLKKEENQVEKEREEERVTRRIVRDAKFVLLACAWFWISFEHVIAGNEEK